MRPIGMSWFRCVQDLGFGVLDHSDDLRLRYSQVSQRVSESGDRLIVSPTLSTLPVLKLCSRQPVWQRQQ